MPTDEETNLILKAAVLKACSRERIKKTEELVSSSTALEREYDLARRLIEDCRRSLQRVRLIHPEKDEPPTSSLDD